MIDFTTDPENFLDIGVESDGARKRQNLPAPDPGPILASLPEPELSATHRELLESSAIDTEIARERGYRTITDPKILVRLGFTPQQRIVPTLLIPFHSVTGTIKTVPFLEKKPSTMFWKRGWYTWYPLVHFEVYQFFDGGKWLQF